MKTCQHVSAGNFLEGQKYRSQVTRDCSGAGKWLSRLDALQFVQGFFFANLKDERDPFVQQMIGVQKFTCFCYCISYLDIQCRVGSLLLDIINFGSPFYFPGVHLARAMLGYHLWFPSKLSKVC